MSDRFLPFDLRISSRLTIWYGLTVLILLGLFALFSYLSFHRSMHRDFDRHLTHEKRELVPFIRVDDGIPVFSSLDELSSVAYRSDGVYGTYVRLLSPDGKVVYRSPNFESHEPLTVHVPDAPGPASYSREWEGEPVRSMFEPVFDGDGGLSGWMEVSGFEWSLNQELRNLRIALIIGTALSLILAISGGFLLSRRALQPVVAMTDAAREIHARDLSARLPSNFPVEDELTRLAHTFNDMIGRLEASFSRERRFTDNAAHELLTPLSTIRSDIDIALRRERESSFYKEKLQSILVDVEEMTETVHGLLQIARVERPHELPAAPVDLGELVHRHAERFRRSAEEKGLRFDLDIRPGTMIEFDATRLGHVIDNLLENAVKYTPAGGTVRVGVERRDGRALFFVMDTGIGFTEEQGAHLFDRFYRADVPDVQNSAGSGLGLAIVDAIVRVYDGSVSGMSEGPGKGSRFEVEFDA